MRGTSTTVLSIALLMSLGPPLAEAGQAGVPIVPGRPHASSYDPHANLGPDRLLTVALQHLSEGRTPEAIQVLSQALARYPDDAGLHKVRGSILLGQGEVAGGLTDLERAVILDPTDPEALISRASAYQAFGRSQDALADLDLALTLAPDSIAARFNRGVLRVGLGDPEGAFADFDQCIALDPHLAPPYFNRAMLYQGLDRRDDAIADLERFIQIARDPRWQDQARELIAAMREGSALVPEDPVANPHGSTPPAASRP